MSFAVVSVVFLRLPSAGRNDRQVLALNVVVYRSDCTKSQRIEESSAARERNRRSYSATATKSNRRAACKIVCWYETSSGVRFGYEWPTMPTKLVQASSQSAKSIIFRPIRGCWETRTSPDVPVDDQKVCSWAVTLVGERGSKQRRRNHGGAGGASPPENLTKGAGTFYVQCSTARSVDLRVRASSRRVCARATLRVPAQHAWEGSCK